MQHLRSGRGRAVQRLHTSKFGLVGFTEALRAEYGRTGLGVTAICPGPVQTNLYRDCETGRGTRAPEPPGWLCTSPDKVARVTLRAIRWNRRMVLVSPWLTCCSR